LARFELVKITEVNMVFAAAIRGLEVAIRRRRMAEDAIKSAKFVYPLRDFGQS
jgi:hypothetical protein